LYSIEGKKETVVKEEPKPSSLVNTVHVTLTGPTGESVPGGFMRPKTEGVFPVVLLLHGLTSDKDAVLKAYGIPLVMRGFAVLALDAPYHGERRKPDVSQTDTDIFGATIHEGVREYRTAIDWLAKRKDIDPNRIGLIGYSLGAMMGAILGAVDERVQDLVLCVGGDPIVSFAPNIPEGKRANMYSVSPSLFVGHISPRRILMLNGRQDMVMLDTAAQRLYDSARQPKTLEWYDSGHILPGKHINRAVLWLVDQLNPTPKS
jgi:dienelactone hydrolase